MVVVKNLTLRGENQARLVERVSAEHATHRIGDQFLDYILSEQLITFRLGFVRIRERGITLQRNAFQRHIAFHIVTHAIRVRDKLIIANLTLTLFLGNPIPILT